MTITNLDALTSQVTDGAEVIALEGDDVPAILSTSEFNAGYPNFVAAARANKSVKAVRIALDTRNREGNIMIVDALGELKEVDMLRMSSSAADNAPQFSSDAHTLLRVLTLLGAESRLLSTTGESFDRTSCGRLLSKNKKITLLKITCHCADVWDEAGTRAVAEGLRGQTLLKGVVLYGIRMSPALLSVLVCGISSNPLVEDVVLHTPTHGEDALTVSQFELRPMFDVAAIDQLFSMPKLAQVSLGGFEMDEDQCRALGNGILKGPHSQARHEELHLA